ncbi:MAG: hypothetical protein IT303_07155 [Dehalococcoidia bacterium]|nr:hypothetical protein [Dehalococcoidia bacterium]
MKIRLALTALVALCVALPLAGTRQDAAAQAIPFGIASETYYRLDVPNGTMRVRVEAEVSPGKGELTEVYLWTMPGATNVVATQDDATLTTEMTAPEPGIPAIVTATLAKPPRGAQRTNIVMNYDVPSQKNEFATLEPGLIEALFVSQDAGSFVFIDMPATGDNYVEPGCLRTASQPKDAHDAGLERFVCGDTVSIAFATEDKAAQKSCTELDDRCRQKALPDGEVFPFTGFAQSITDDAKKGVLEGELALSGGPVKVTLKYFKTDAAWAQRQFDIAMKAVPLLEAAYGWPYPHDVVNLRQSRFIELGGALGVAFPDEGQMLIANVDIPGVVSEEVTIHELAHQWAGSNLETSWLWEGLAEYGMRVVAPSFGFTPYNRRWDSYPWKDPLATWWHGSSIMNPDYWYGKSGAFWFEYEKAIGGRENMIAALGQMDDAEAKWPLDGEWFMDAGERVSGANLDELFLTWVYNRESAAPLIAERRAAHDKVKELTARAAQMGLPGVPADIQGLLDEWQFGPVPALVTSGNSVLDDYKLLTEETAAAGLPVGDAVAKSWGTVSVELTRRAIVDQRQAIAAIGRAATELAGQPEDAPSMVQLADARTKYTEGDYVKAEQLAATSTTTAYNQVAAKKMIAIAKEEQAAYKPSFLGKVGMFWADPDGDLASAEEAYASGDPTKALGLAKSAYTGWTEAEKRGLMRLAMLAGAMCLVTVGTYYLLRRLDPDRNAVKPLGQGHVLTDEGRGGWQDWENRA